MITTIPPDVAVRILSFIDSSDVINVMLTSRRRHYGVQSDLVGVAWGNDHRYWHTQEDTNGECGRIMHLRSVCWFDIQTVFNVPNGTWYAVWRIRRESNWDISFGAADKVGTSNDQVRQSNS
ncbi:hypothetical protein BKA69DRAFT_270386 [Paraphysoderma sedebokerense]|nr:hypothetical protein BKA69DRAFT_270386 [Paraphysoderma sedebokerense]